jgi:hypothetical protein
MYINIEVRTASTEVLKKICDATDTEPIKHHNLTCGHNHINITYSCSKNDASALKKHWKDRIPECLIVSV